jgi:hypothetical protein
MSEFFDCICIASQEILEQNKASLRCSGSGNANPITCLGCPYCTTMYGCPRCEETRSTLILTSLQRNPEAMSKADDEWLSHRNTHL